ncbi:MAG: hypothetical protein EOO88_00040 [Pedobacter sp.]|nr:MAG: hypothetical protein EOO88_00040 [Pedobacter sp.]
MNTEKFNTNIKCNGCLEKVTPGLDTLLGPNNWEVDLKDPNKVLTVSGDINSREVMQTVSELGFNVEKV